MRQPPVGLTAVFISTHNRGSGGVRNKENQGGRHTVKLMPVTRERVLQAGFLDGVGTGAVTTLMSVVVTERWGLDTLGLIMAGGLFGRGVTMLWGWYAQRTKTHTNRDHYVLAVSVMVLASLLVCAQAGSANVAQICVLWAFFVGSNSISTVQLSLRILKEGSKFGGATILGSGVSALLVGLIYTAHGYAWSQACAVLMCLLQGAQLWLTRSGDKNTTDHQRRESEKTQDSGGLRWGVRGFVLALFLYAPIVMQTGLIARWHQPAWSGPAALTYALVPLFLKMQNTATEVRYTGRLVLVQSMSTLFIPINPVVAVITRVPAAYSLFALQNQTQIRAANESGESGVSAFNLGVMSGGVLGAGWFGFVTDKTELWVSCVAMTFFGMIYALLIERNKI